MKRIFTACITVLFSALMLMLTVLVLQQNGFLAKPSSPDKASGTGGNVPLTEFSTSSEEKTPEKNAAAAGASEDLVQAYLWARQKDLEARALLMPGATYTMPYADRKRLGDYNCFEYTVSFQAYSVTKDLAGFEVQWIDDGRSEVKIDRSGRIADDWSYVVVEADVICDDWMYVSLQPFFFLYIGQSYRESLLYPGPNSSYDRWSLCAGGNIFAWNPLTANADHPIETDNKSYSAQWQGGVNYHFLLVWLIQDKYLPDDGKIYLVAGHGGDGNYDLPVINAGGTEVGQFNSRDPDSELFPHRELP